MRMARQTKRNSPPSAEPVADDPLAVADAGDVVAALPPELGEAEGELDDPEDAEPSIASSIPVPMRPAADSRTKRTPQRHSRRRHRRGRQLREEEAPADDALVVLGALELGRGGRRRASTSGRSRPAGTTLCQRKYAAAAQTAGEREEESGGGRAAWLCGGASGSSTSARARGRPAARCTGTSPSAGTSSRSLRRVAEGSRRRGCAGRAASGPWRARRTTRGKR